MGSKRAIPPVMTEVLAAQNLERWQQLGEAVRGLLPPPGFQRAFPKTAAAWSPAEQGTWLEAALAIAHRSARAAVAVYKEAPPALSSLPPAPRRQLLDLLKVTATGADPDQLSALIPVLGAIVLDVPPAERAGALDLALSVAETCPAAVPGLLRCLARLIEEAPGERVREWATRGLDMARSHPETARAYFALESLTSVRLLHSSPTAVALKEVEGVLHRYIQMMGGEPAFVRASGPFRLRPPLEEEPLAGGVVLPATVDVLDTWEENARLYRILSAFLAGRREFGTYATSDIVAHIRNRKRPAAVEECFLLADGYRIACQLLTNYPGIGNDLAWATEAILARWQDAAPSATLLLDTLLAQAISPIPRKPLQPWAAGAAALVLPCLRPLAAPDATARDALVVAELLDGLLSLPNTQEASETALAAAAETLFASGEDGTISGNTGDPAEGTARISHPGNELSPDMLAELQIQLEDLAENMTAAGRPLTAEELARLAESGLISQLSPGGDSTVAQAGLYVTQLVGKILSDHPRERRRSRLSSGTAGVPHIAEGGPMFFYDEWDHVIADYRPAWCCLREVDISDDGGAFFTRTLEHYAPLVPEIRRHFQRVRPESWRVVRSLEDGEDFDLNAAIDARAEWRAHRSPSSKLYTARARLEREVATLFLLDMSASTDEAADVAGNQRRIIDIEKEALVIMAAALEEIGDAYAIYGFSGQGRHNVEFYPVKTFRERLRSGAKGRIGGIQPRSSTRMGAPLRHSVRKMADARALALYLILISDGFPQDLDYGEDRRSYDYGINDTAVALRELEAACIKPFCITVDLAGHDYLRDMCDPQRYLVIENVGDLPRELPKIYQRLVRAA